MFQQTSSVFKTAHLTSTRMSRVGIDRVSFFKSNFSQMSKVQVNRGLEVKLAALQE
jgi:hypothetical protein